MGELNGSSVDKIPFLLYNKFMKPYEYSELFKIKYCDCDFKDELKPSTTLALMEEVACASADELNFGYAFLKPRGVAFMVSNVVCEFYQPMRLGEKICLKTWPLVPSYATFGREYQIYSQEGVLQMNASSRWCAIDVQSGKVLSSKFLDNQDYSTYNQARALDVTRWKIPAFAKADGVLKFQLCVANSEYDHNMHVNNTKYADYCFNCFSIAELAKHTLKRFALSYVRQCKEGEMLYFYRKQGTEDGLYYVQGYNEQDEIVVQCEIVLE